jgi:transposase-like protein
MEKILEVNDKVVKDHLGELVRGSVEETLNSLLDAEADRICNAQRYEHSAERTDTRAGHYERGLDTRVGKVSLKIPKLRSLPFETMIIERYRRRETSIEEAIIEMYLAGVSVRRVEDITEALWGTRVSAGKVSELNQKAYEHIEAWRNRPLSGEYAYVYLDGIWLKRSWGGEVSNVSVLAAIGVNEDGYREVIGCAEGAKEDKESWLGFLRHLKERGLCGTQLFISDKCLGLIEALGEVFPEAKWQRCLVHFYRNVFSVTPRGMLREVAAMLKAIHAQEDKEAARVKSAAVVEKLKAMKLFKASETVREGIEETLTYMDFPREHRVRIRTNNALERLFKEVRRRTRVVGSFPDGHSALMLTAARLRHMASSKWGEKRYLNMRLLEKSVTANTMEMAA